MTCIALFDSGVGGLSILPALENVIPHADIVYLADHAHSPYGSKDAQWLNSRMAELVTQIEKQHQPDIIIIACNTASTLCLDNLRALTQTPIIGVVPAIKTAAQLSERKFIGILATPVTVAGEYLQALINEFASTCHVTKVGSTELVTMAERKLCNSAIDTVKLQTLVAPFVTSQCDVVVLGCTHFPHLLTELKQCAPHIQWIDSANAIAKRCEHLLAALPTKSDAPHQANNHLTKQAYFYSTGLIDAQLTQTLYNMGFHQINSKAIP